MQPCRWNTYGDYMRSRHWKDIKRKYLRNKCYCCSLEGRFRLYHYNLDNLGREQSEDVVTLCPGCAQRANVVKSSKAPMRIVLTKHGRVPGAKKTPTKIRNKWVNWKDLIDQEKNESIPALRNYFVKYGLFAEGKITPKALALHLARTVDGEIKWHKVNFKAYRLIHLEVQPYPVDHLEQDKNK